MWVDPVSKLVVLFELQWTHWRWGRVLTKRLRSRSVVRSTDYESTKGEWFVESHWNYFGLSSGFRTVGKRAGQCLGDVWGRGFIVAKISNPYFIMKMCSKSSNCLAYSQAFGRALIGYVCVPKHLRVASSCPGKPTDNAFVESFNGALRAESKDAHCFMILQASATEIL